MVVFLLRHNKRYSRQIQKKNTSVITRVCVGMNGLVVDSRSHSQLRGDKVNEHREQEETMHSAGLFSVVD